MTYPLSICMAHHTDFDGLYFTVQSLKLHQYVPECELVVVDNSPGIYGDSLKNFLGSASNSPEAMYPGFANVKYIEADPKDPAQCGTSNTRGRAIAEAEGDWKLILDCHVLLPEGTIDRIINAIRSDRLDPKNIYSGPILFDHFRGAPTHLNPTWGAGMFGQWGIAWEHPTEKGTWFTMVTPDQKTCFPAIVNGFDYKRIEVEGIPEGLGYAGHESFLRQAGFIPFRGGLDGFEIPGQGLGLFLVHKDYWPGFHPEHREFGGEEMYIHEKYRQRGGKAICLPWLEWNHRFFRAGRTPYVNRDISKARNYVLEWNELGLPLDSIHTHFVGERILSQDRWDTIVADPSSYTPVSPPENPVVAEAPIDNYMVRFEAIYQQAADNPRDLNQHMMSLRRYSQECNHVTDISERIESLVGLMSGRPKHVVSFNKEINSPVTDRLRSCVTDGWLNRLDTTMLEAEPETIENTDLLFLDTNHTGEHVEGQLLRYHGLVNKYIIIHDTELFGHKGPDGKPGLVHVIKNFIADHPEWTVYDHDTRQFGLTVLARDKEPDHPVAFGDTLIGPGTELEKLLEGLGITGSENCGCKKLRNRMNAYGKETLQTNQQAYDECLASFRTNAKAYKWRDRISASLQAVRAGYVLWMNPLSPLKSLFDRAIKLAPSSNQST